MVHHVEGWHQHFRTELLRLLGGLVGVRDRHIRIPVRRHTHLALVGTDRVRGGRFLAAHLENGIGLIRPNRRLVDVPAEQGAVEGNGCLLIGRG
jgi:hypothetical protein